MDRRTTAEARIAARHSLAPDGQLRVAVNFGNPVLARADGAGAPSGVSVDLAMELARQLDVAASFVTFDSARKVFEAAAIGVWSLAFLAVDPARAAQISFTAPYLAIEATCVVRDGAPYCSVDDLDQPGLRLAVGKGAAYELALSRRLQRATLVRADTSAAALRQFLDEGLEAAAGVRSALQAFAAEQPGLRLFEGVAADIRQALAVPLDRQDSVDFLERFLDDAKTSGFLAQSLKAHDQPDARII